MVKAKKKQIEVAIIMGSQSDWPVMKEAASTLKTLGISYEAQVVSAHRTPKKMYDFSESAESSGFQVIIAGAGGAAHLPGMVASLTNLPVIGVPIATTALQGQDSLMSIVQMPKGVPVATVAINNATNAALLAARILGASPNKAVRTKLESYRKRLEKQVLSQKLK